jgi:leucyl aminopeptidase (aminopeptidase T)
MAYATRSPAAATLLAAVGVTATLFGSSLAAAADVSKIELRRLLDPTEAELAAEAEGRIYIYDGLTDRDIQEAMNEEFERVENMMFIRTRKTNADGELKRNEDTGEVEVADDGC